MPETTPDELIVPTDVLLLLHVPPPVALLSVIVAVTHSTDAPVMVPAEGVEVTVTIFVVDALPQLPVTV